MDRLLELADCLDRTLGEAQGQLCSPQIRWWLCQRPDTQALSSAEVFALGARSAGGHAAKEIPTSRLLPLNPLGLQELCAYVFLTFAWPKICYMQALRFPRSPGVQT